MRPAALLLVLAFATIAPAQDVNDKTEAAIQAAVARVAPSVVRVETAGGAEMVGVAPGGGVRGGGVRKGQGPTTGLVVAADGYVITSSFNFSNKPATIFVSVPGRKEKYVAKQVATDTTRMLTLVKIEATGLPVPVAMPKSEAKIGQWSVAVGRAFGLDENSPPSVSVGIVSALGRMYGKATQTDAKVSPVNYGGPLVGVDGRVLGVLVPASPRGESEAAGVEWYDSGIGFAVPLDDVFAVLPKLRAGKDLRRGQLGISAASGDLYTEPVKVGKVSPDSAAAKAGIKAGDTITKLDGKPVENFSQLQHLLGPKYEGDKVAVTIRRESKDVVFPDVVLSGTVTAFVNPYLGILPLRDDPEPGVGVRFVFPKSPAEAAGLKAGDRVMKFGVVGRPGQPEPPMAPLPGHGRNQLAVFVTALEPGADVKLEVKRKDGGKTETVTAKLGLIPETLPETIPPESSAGKALDKAKPAPGGGGPMRPMPKEDAPAEEKKEEKKKDDEKKEPETGLVKRQNATLGREYWVYIPDNYTPNVSHGLIVWLHPAGKGGGKDAEDMVKVWQQFCADQHYILMGPQSQNGVVGWLASETEAVTQDVKEVLGQYTIDRRRVVAHGMGVGGQMAFYLGFNSRDTFRGVATTGAVLGTQPKDNVPTQPLEFFVVAGEKDPALKDIAGAKPAIAEKRFPIIYRAIADFGKEYMDQKTLIELCVWLDSLDKI